jgi:hypothetical protein
MGVGVLGIDGFALQEGGELASIPGCGGSQPGRMVGAKG